MSWTNYTEIDVSAGTSQNVTTDDAVFVGAWVSTALSAHAVTINDGASGTNVHTLAASAAIGDKVEGHDIRMANGINLVCDALGTGKIIVAWKRSELQVV